MDFFIVGSFIFFTVLVALVSWHMTKKEDLKSNDGYFLGGRSLSGVVIAGSLLLTNLSTEQLVGMNGNAFRGGLSIIGWEVTSGITLVFMALIFLPKYLKSGITTVPEFLEDRFDKTTRNIVAILFLISLAFILLPSVLYSGGLALNSLFNVSELLGVSETQSLVIVIWGIGIIGGIYAIFGGLKAVAVSDTINGVGLILGGSLIPILGFKALGDGSFLDGVQKLIIEQPEKLNAIGSSSDPVPFGTLFCGIILINTFYWCTNQAIVQRTFGAKNLAEGQKGVIYAAFFKMFIPIILAVPGIIALQMFGAEAVSNGDMAYSMLVARVLPKPLLGFFGAVLFGAVLSSFNSALNSASTLFCLNLYKPIVNPKIKDNKLVIVGKYFGTALALFSILVAPRLASAPQGIYTFMRMFMGFINVPTLVIIIVGFTTTRVPAIAAKISLFTFVTLYGILQFVYKPDIHFLYILGILFVLCVAIMLVIGKIMPLEKPYKQKQDEKVSMEYWDKVYPISGVIVVTSIYVYTILSPLGISGTGESAGKRALIISIIYVITSIITYIKLLPKKRENIAQNSYN